MKEEIACKDYSVSGEDFSLVYDKGLKMYKTKPKPTDNKLVNYYKTENYISHKDHSRTFFEKVYQMVKKYNLKQKLHLIESLALSGKSILDVGCGTGSFLAVCKKNGWKTEGVEPVDNARRTAENKLKQALYKDVFHIDEKAKYDLISLWHVLEHVPDYEAYIRHLKNLLKKDGVLLIAVPNYKSYDAKYYGKYWAAWDVPRHLWHFSQESMHHIFQQQNMEIIKTLPMKWDAYYVSLLSETYKHGKKNWIKAFFIGFLSNWKARKNLEYASLIYVIKNKNT